MPLAKIHVLEGQYDEARLARVSRVQRQGMTVNTYAEDRAKWRP